ncbi:GMC family oxidoreductase [Hymenobacter sp. RP-2-7]|uniref:GMC family oxidoreductase n=1 Tax=Hymenobacter polaris TaxID=2682546 RepID=A0A7Y0AA87_9BACT|nr:GMC family oxidoreductase [Hymenobacter polaris]NML63641.1 GMC family oxidoreductase [Hymenobacter polaris]
MIIDYNDASVSQIHKCDICIVGSGAAALAFLTKFYETSHQIIVLEAGGEEITTQNQEIYNTSNVFHPLPGAKEGRFRVFGGSTTKWGGQSLPLDPIDFAKRDWVPSSGWPIPYEEVAKYYPAVDTFLGLELNSYESNIFDLLQTKEFKKTNDLKFKFSKWSPKPNLREEYRKKISTSTNVKLIQNANLIAINLSENNKKVESISITNFLHKKGTLEATIYILACGGIENARLLLASNHQNSKGIGNNYDIVGRYLQDHPNSYIGNIKNSTSNTQKYFNYFFINKTRYLPRFILSERFQTTHQVLNASASILFFPQENDVFSKVLEIYRKQVRGTITINDIVTFMQIGRQVNQLIRPAISMLFHKKVFTPNPSVKLNLMIENPPEWTNRVKLSKEYDALGTPIAIIEWKINEQVKHTLDSCAKLFAEYFPYLNVGDLQLEEWLDSADWSTRIKDAYHHIGTTRMSNSQKDGVVDANCKIFGLENLYIAGSSVFPTSGHSNPTSTIIALTFRLSEHIKAILTC